jgi:hypothetical protein
MIYNLKEGGLQSTMNRGELVLDNLSTIGMEYILNGDYCLVRLNLIALTSK